MTTPENMPNQQTSPRLASQGPDLIPVWLLSGIVVVVLALAWFVLSDNWYTDWTRYQSIEAQKNRDWETAIKDLQKLRETGAKTKNPYMENSPTYLSELGYSYFGLGQNDKAIEYYNLAQANRNNVAADDSGNVPPAPDFHNMIGLIYYKQNKLDEAEAALQKALQFNKLDPLSNFTMGEIAMKRGNYTKAADYFKVVANDPSYKDQVQAYYAEIEKKLFAGIN